MKYNRPFFLLIILLVPAVGLFLMAGCQAPPSAVATPPSNIIPDPPANLFVGNDACAECHHNEFQTHQKSFHAASAHLVSDLGPIKLPQGDLFGSQCRLRAEGNSFRVIVGDSDAGAETMQYGIGSGKTGITFVALTDSKTLFEMRASYFPKIQQWYITPGQKKMDVDEMGFDYPPDKGRLCMSCHTTTLPNDSIIPERKFLGVGCEACHGPGSFHIAAVKSKDLAHLQMEKLGEYNAEKLNTLCGRCHRTEQDVLQRSPHLIGETQRFQTLGIMKSRCYKESQGHFSCLNCHDPHANASTSMKVYETACLTCHTGHSAQTVKTSKSVPATACPVNPRSGCIPCHMPARKILPNADTSPYAVDHFIRIPPKGSHPSPYRLYQQ